jgi:hypothetical protein
VLILQPSPARELEFSHRKIYGSGFGHGLEELRSPSTGSFMGIPVEPEN